MTFEPLLTLDQALAALECSEDELDGLVRDGSVAFYRLFGGRFDLNAEPPTPRPEPELEPAPEPTPILVAKPPSVDRMVRAALRVSAALGGEPLDPGASFVYVIQAGEDGPVKVGVASNLDRLRVRISGVQTGCPETLTIRRLFQGGYALEGALHRRLSASHLRGEWFRPTSLVQMLIERPGLDWLPTRSEEPWPTDDELAVGANPNRSGEDAP